MENLEAKSTSPARCRVGNAKLHTWLDILVILTVLSSHLSDI
jgi:hypothetical protein